MIDTPIIDINVQVANILIKIFQKKKYLLRYLKKIQIVFEADILMLRKILKLKSTLYEFLEQ